MKKIGTWLWAALLPGLLGAGELELTGFDTLEAAQKAGWTAQSTAILSMPEPGVLRAVGSDQKPYCGLRLQKTLTPDAAGTVSFEVRMNFGKHVYVGLSTQAGYFDLYLPIQRDQWQSVSAPLDIARWRFSGKGEKPAQWGKATLLSILNPEMKKSTEFIEIRNLRFTAAAPDKPAAPAVAAGAPKLQTALTEFFFQPETGALQAIRDRGRDQWVVTGTENHYFVQRKSGDAEAFESGDKAEQYRNENGELVFECVNPALPGLRIVKHYRLDGERLRRRLEFRNSGSDTAYVTPRTRVRFAPDFYDKGFYLGSGYIGPLMPVPALDAAKREVAFKQTTKGMLLYHDGAPGSFTQYRTHLNGKFVFPWWQSAISSYQEDANALYYQPDGWEMALGTVDVRPGRDFTVDDCFVFFQGNWHAFLNDIYPHDPEVQKVLGAFEPGPDWLKDVKVEMSTNKVQDLQQLVSLIDDGEIIYMFDATGSWADYRIAEGREGFNGGMVSGEELRDHMARLRKISPRLRIGFYNWINSASIHAPVFKEHPEYFMLRTRAGAAKNLFPGGFALNFPTMVNRPAAAEFMLGNFSHIIDYLNVDYIYLDETKTTNLIDWDHDDLVRDDHWNDFWMGMYRLGRSRNVVMFGNGRGNPYHELNYIEAINQLAPERWREFCGMAMAVANFVNNRKGARVDLLYWNTKMDYITRVLANGFIPTVNFLRYQQIPYITANAELGKSTIYDLKYTPDWKNDPATELESYCIRRDSGNEMIFSVINRASRDSVQATLDTAGLGGHLTVWCYRIMRYPDDVDMTYGFGEKERKSNYRATGWREGVIARPELVYSGDNPGKLELKLDHFPTGEFAQFVISGSDAGVYSVDGMPKNYFLTVTPKVKIAGSVLPVKVESSADVAEVILTGAPGVYAVNGKPVTARPVEFDGRLFAVVPVGKGESTIAYADKAEYPSRSFEAKIEDGKLVLSGNPGFVTIKKDGLLYYCGDAPVLPEFHDAGTIVVNTLDGKHPVELKIATGKPSPAMLIEAPPLQPAVSTLQPIAPIERDGAKVVATATYTSRWNAASGVQPDMPPLMAKADPATLSLTAGTTDKVVDNLGHAAAGFLLEHADKVELEFSSTFAAAGGKLQAHVWRHRRHGSEFAGIMLDFERAGGKFERQALSAGVLNYQRTQPGSHQYGSKQPADKVFELGNWLDDRESRRFTLDLKKLAPADWTGKVFLSAATGWVNPGRRITLKLIAFNQKAVAPEIIPLSRAEFEAEFKAPRRGDIPLLSGMADFDAVMRQGWAIPKFYKLGGVGFPACQTKAAVARDADNLYVAFDVMDADAVDNAVEIWLRGANGKLWQFICAPGGTYQTYCDNYSSGDRRFRLRRVGEGRFLGAIPFAMTGTPEAGAEWIFNISRLRPPTRESAEELSSYAPLMRGFGETEQFARIAFGAPPPEAKKNAAAVKPEKDTPAAAAAAVQDAAAPERVVNLGRGGYTTANIRKETLPLALRLKPALTIVLAGTNDMLNTGKLATFEQFESHLRFIVGELRKNGSQVVLNTLPPCSEKLLLARHAREKFGDQSPGARIERANEIIRNIAADTGSGLYDLHALIAASGDPDAASSLLRNRANDRVDDGVHLRKEGYELWAEKLMALPAVSALPADGVIVCLGDSLTYGAGMAGAGTSSGDTMPGCLRRLMEAKERK